MKGVVLVLGEEHFLARQAIEDLLSERPELEAVRFSGDEVEAGAVLDEVRTPTLFGGGRAVIVEEAGTLLAGDALAALAAYASRPAIGEALLILRAAGLDRRRKGARALLDHAREIRADPLRPRDVAGWVAQRGRRAHGLDVRPEAVQALRSLVGDDLGLLDQALGRLKEQIAPRQRLDAADVTGSTEEQRPVGFEVQNALEARDLSAALQALREAFAEGVSLRHEVVTDPRAIATILLAGLHRKYGQLIRFQMALQAGQQEAEAARTAGTAPAAVPYFARRARRFPLGQLLERHERFVAADLSLKRSRDEPRRVLERLLVDLLGS